MRWIVGIDMRPRSFGALKYASWLDRASTQPDDEHFVVVHVLEEDHLRYVLRYHHLDEVVASARSSAERVLEQQCGTDWIESLQVVQGLTADATLEKARADRSADAVVIGRAAPRESHRLTRLGQVARRMLRHAEGPVIVVPPDVEPATLGAGPVMALTDLGVASEDAVRFAARVAERLGRTLAVVHVTAHPEEHGAWDLPQGSMDGIRRDRAEEADRALRAWLASTGVKTEHPIVLQGSLIESVLVRAEELEVPLVVAGSPRLSPIERALWHGTAVELAASSPRPVAVVPQAR
jgi:nucleotide-binding universal stress UspA family protein